MTEKKLEFKQNDSNIAVIKDGKVVGHIKDCPTGCHYRPLGMPARFWHQAKPSIDACKRSLKYDEVV